MSVYFSLSYASGVSGEEKIRRRKKIASMCVTSLAPWRHSCVCRCCCCCFFTCMSCTNPRYMRRNKHCYQNQNTNRQTYGYVHMCMCAGVNSQKFLACDFFIHEFAWRVNRFEAFRVICFALCFRLFGICCCFCCNICVLHVRSNTGLKRTRCSWFKSTVFVAT